jgi:hypothetical protein
MARSTTLSADARRVALALYNATRAGVQSTVGDLAAATDMSVDGVLDAVRSLTRADLVKPRGIRGMPGGMLPVDWSSATEADLIAIRARLELTMTSLLPAALEGDLEYSPAADEEIVDQAISAALENLDPVDYPNPRDIVVTIELPEPRRSEAYDRIAQRVSEVGMRMRMIIEVTFPNMTPGDESIDRFVKALPSNSAVECNDVQIIEATSVPFVRADDEYHVWRYESPNPRKATPGGTGLRRI